MDATQWLAAGDAGDVAVYEHAVCAMGRRLRHQMRLTGKTMKQVTVHTYRQDPYYPRVVRAVATILARADVVAPVDVLLEMGNLTPKNHGSSALLVHQGWTTPLARYPEQGEELELLRPAYHPGCSSPQAHSCHGL